jgi:hypothetical protein
VSGKGAETFLAANGEGRIVEAGPAGEHELLARPGIAFDNHLRVLDG